MYLPFDLRLTPPISDLAHCYAVVTGLAALGFLGWFLFKCPGGMKPCCLGCAKSSLAASIPGRGGENLGLGFDLSMVSGKSPSIYSGATFPLKSHYSQKDMILPYPPINYGLEYS